MNEDMYEWMVKWRYGGMNQCMNEKMNKCWYVLMYGWMNVDIKVWICG